jgi:hypothetical protein
LVDAALDFICGNFGLHSYARLGKLGDVGLDGHGFETIAVWTGSPAG